MEGSAADAQHVAIGVANVIMNGLTLIALAYLTRHSPNGRK